LNFICACATLGALEDGVEDGDWDGNEDGERRGGDKKRIICVKSDMRYYKTLISLGKKVRVAIVEFVNSLQTPLYHNNSSFILLAT
jgi:hypothetical protein